MFFYFWTSPRNSLNDFRNRCSDENFGTSVFVSHQDNVLDRIYFLLYLCEGNAFLQYPLFHPFPLIFYEFSSFEIPHWSILEVRIVLPLPLFVWYPSHPSTGCTFWMAPHCFLRFGVDVVQWSDRDMVQAGVGLWSNSDNYTLFLGNHFARSWGL